MQQTGDHAENLIRTFLERRPADALVGLVRLLEITRPANQRNHSGSREPSAVGAEKRAPPTSRLPVISSSACSNAVPRGASSGGTNIGCPNSIAARWLCEA